MSAQPPAQAIEINSQYLETVWTWITDHADISVKDIEPNTDDVNTATQEESSAEVKDAAPIPADQADFFMAHAGSRLCTTEERIWYALTDHGVDWKRLPKLEFQCLSIIAAHGPAGVLQPDLVRLSGQDKRSVPRRTDTLHSKGYVVKESCLGGGIKTSLLRLKKFVKSDETTAHFGISTNVGNGPSISMIRYDQWFDQLIGLLKENKRLMTFDDLRVRMGVQNNTLQTRSLHRCVRRLVASGLLRKLKARQRDTDDLEHDENSLKVRKKKLKKNEDLWLRCIMLLRDPLDSDRYAFERGAPPATGYAAAPKIIHDQVSWNRNGQDLTLVDEEEADSDGDAEVVDLPTFDTAPRNGGFNRINLPPQWTAGTHYSNRFFDIIESRGPHGISSMDLVDLGFSRVFKRPFDEAVGKITDLWHMSQPPHLRHLAIIRDTNIQGTNFHFLFRTFDNFQRAVDAGKASWDYVLDKEEKIVAANQSPDLDEWGFPHIADEQLVDGKGIASITECVNSAPVSSKHSLPDYADKRPKGKWKKLWKQNQEKTTPSKDKKARGRPKKARGTSTVLTDQANSPLDKPSADLVPGTPSFDATPDPATPRKPPKESATPSRTISNISEKRQEKEMTEWKLRTRLRAEFVVRKQIEDTREAAREAERQAAAALIKPTPGTEPPKKRKRGRPTKAEAAEAKLAEEQRAIAEAEAVKVAVEAKAAAEAEAVRLTEEAKARAAAEAEAEAKRALAEQNAAAFGDRDGIRNNEDLQSSSKGKKKRKRQSDGEEAVELPEDQVNAIQKEIEAMSIPGVYINPPGSGLTKLLNYPSLGRPRTSLIAVFKTPKLLTLEWFKSEKPNHKRHDLAGSGRPPGSAKSRGTELATKIPDHAGDTFTRITEPDVPVLSASAASPTEQLLHDSEHLDVETRNEDDVAVVSRIFDDPQAFVASGTSGQAETGTICSVEKTNAQNPESTVQIIPVDRMDEDAMEVDSTERGQGILERNSQILGQASEQSLVDNVQTSDQIGPMDLDKPSESFETDQVQSEINRGLEQTVQKDVEMQDSTVKNALETRLEKEQGVSQARRQSQDVVKSSQAERNRPSYTKRDGVHSNGGMIRHQRSRIALDIVRQCGGIFPGDREMFFPFVTVWLRMFGQQPDRQTIDRIIKNLLASNKLINKTFAFKTEHGNVVKKHIIMEPGIEMNAPAVLEMEKRIEEAHPAPFVPEQAPLHPDMRTQIANHPANLSRERNIRADAMKERRALLANYQDHFPEDTTQTVRSAEIVSLGMTDQRLQQSIARRQKKAEQDAKRADRLMRKVRGEVVEPDAELEGESTFALTSYTHDPSRARVDRGPKGRARLGRVIQLEKPKKPAGAPLGSLRSIRQQQQQLSIVPSKYTRLQGQRSRGRPAHPPVIEVTLTIPKQTYYNNIGVFSTDASIPVVLPRSLEEIIDRVRFPKEIEDWYTDVASNEFDRQLHLVLQWELREARRKHYYGHVRYQPFSFINHVGPKPPQSNGNISLDWTEVDVAYKDAPLERWFDGSNRTAFAATSLSDLQQYHGLSSWDDPDMAEVAMQMRPGHGSYGMMMLDSSNVAEMNSMQPYGPIYTHSWLNDVEGLLVPPHMRQEEAYREAYDLPDTVRNKVRQGPFKQPKRSQKSLRQPLLPKPKPAPKRQVFPPPSNMEVYTMSKEEDERLVLAIAVVKTMVGGLEQSNRAINWGLVHQVFKYKFDAKYCRSRWDTLRFRYTPTMERYQQQVRRIVLRAYEQQEVPGIDLAYPEKVDWSELVTWMEANLEDEEPELPEDLPETRQDFDEDFELRMPNEVYQPDMEDFFSGTAMQLRREEMVKEMSFVVAHKESLSDSMLFLKSWIRAEALTYHAGLAGPDGDLEIVHLEGYKDLRPRVVEELTTEKFFRRETAPGRNGARVNIPAETMMGSLNRTFSIGRFVEAAAFKMQIDAAFADNGVLAIDYLADDAANMAIQNLVSEGRAVIVPVLPEVAHDFDTPWPKLSKWGFTDANYKTVHMDKERLQFGLELVPTDTYIYDNPLKVVEIPLSRQYEGEPGPRLPFWTTLSGALIKDNWENLLASVLFLLATRSGIRSEGLSKAHRGKIWAWEIEIMLEWAEKVGLARLMEGGDGGWTTGEWWWMAMAERG